MTLPTFRTARLLVRPRTLDDLEACLAMDRDPEVARFVAGPWADPVAHRAFVIERMRTVYPHGMGYWSVLDPAAREAFVGWILLLPYQAFADEVEIGWRFVPSARGRGYATEAAAAVLDHAFRTLGLGTVVADIDPENRPSIRVAEKLGMRHAGDRTIDGAPARSYRIDRDAPGPPVRSSP